MCECVHDSPSVDTIISVHTPIFLIHIFCVYTVGSGRLPTLCESRRKALSCHTFVLTIPANNLLMCDRALWSDTDTSTCVRRATGALGAHRTACLCPPAPDRHVHREAAHR